MPISLTDSPEKKRHFLVVPHALWGHLGPSIALSANLIEMSRHVMVTLLIPSILASAASDALNRCEYDPSRLKIIHTDLAFMNMKKAEGFIEPAMKALMTIYAALITCSPTIDAISKLEITPFDISPTTALIDITIAARAIKVLPKLNRVYGKDVKLCCLAPLSAQWAIWSQETMNEPEEERERAYEKWIGSNEDIVHVPGLSPMYVFETCPNQRDGYVPLMLPVLESLHRWDGLVNIWPSFLGKAFQAYNDSRGIVLMQVGSQSLTIEKSDTEFGNRSEEQKTHSFLDRCVRDFGKQSVLYICFGSLFFSPKLRQLATMLDTLATLSIPYILANGGSSPEIQEMCACKCHSHPYGLNLGWAPQKAILAHGGIMAFLTHAGSNSILGAIQNSVPLVFWPATYDQVQTALAFSYPPLQIGVELSQVRNGYNIGRKTAAGILVEGTDAAMKKEFTEVFTGLHGALGDRLRDRVKSMNKEMMGRYGVWKESTSYGASAEFLRSKSLAVSM